MVLPFDSLLETHFVTLPSQSNIYGLSTLCVGGVHKVLVASCRRQVVCVEYVQNKPDDIVPASKEIHFTYIPGGAEIISIDSFNKSTFTNDFIVGITFSKPTDSPAVQYFNIYTDWEPKAELSLDSIAQSCVSLKLNFIPCQLYHTELWNRDGFCEIVWLLSGSDGEIHLYKEDKEQHTYYECNVHEYFTEFSGLKRIVLWMDVVQIQDDKRITAVGCEDGYIQVTVTQCKTNEILYKWELKHDSIISCIKFFKTTSSLQKPSYITHAVATISKAEYDDVFHLLVISTLEVAVVYWNVLADGFARQLPLPGSDEFDCAQCACVADIDMDGFNEIIIGTYGQQMLIYKYGDDDKGFSKVSQRSFAYPLLSIEYLDITGDGLNELIILSTKGLHILQHALHVVEDILMQRLQQLKKTMDEKNESLPSLKQE